MRLGYLNYVLGIVLLSDVGHGLSHELWVQPHPSSDRHMSMFLVVWGFSDLGLQLDSDFAYEIVACRRESSLGCTPFRATNVDFDSYG
ncbi:hypothetical protein M758_6G053600 [Ceratodon purpureus]|uniref:Secreted protein n=1 Tax=Ceratodon purpureus TaxID=3225 RepID=A0A8T0HCJ4_CERPU|nr:hypothetical protein KC19_6G057400 [Ceratodon purpureus]KAG0612806.1 hypothetical protein M758_6G053600 [Ceratodon purpureus]